MGVGGCLLIANRCWLIWIPGGWWNGVQEAREDDRTAGNSEGGDGHGNDTPVVTVSVGNYTNILEIKKLISNL